MRTRWLTLLAVALAVVVALPAGAVDAPHDGSFTEGLCQTCHKLHAAGGTLVNQIDNNTTCTTCHNKKVGSLRGFPWLTDQQATPGVSGDQHSWTGYATSAPAGALPPQHAEMAARVNGGMLQCSTCHDQHAANQANAPSSVLTSIPVGVATDESGNASGGGGTARLTLSPIGAGAQPKGTRLRIRTVTAGGGTFILSHDSGMTTPTWFVWSGSAWVPGTVTGTGKPYTNDAPVTIDDPAVSVALTSGAAVGDYWDFSISFPFLRASNVNDAMCQDCHRDRVMDHFCIEGGAGCVADGTRQFSHPVNQELNANLKNYDRTPANPDPNAQAVLDANGSDQAAGDGNPTNDLRLMANGQVGCTTCHAPHNADSNSLSIDPR